MTFGEVSVRIHHVALAAALLLPVAAQAQAPKPAKAAASTCDRRRLLHVLTEYTEAIGDNSTARLKLSPKVRTTYNGVETPLGKGDIWAANRRLPYRQVFVDPVTGAAVFYGIVTDAVPRGPAAAAAPKPRWWFYVARLKVAGGQITEVEEIAYEKPPGGFGADPADLHLPED